MGYDSGRLELVRQAVAGAKKFQYTDTGGETVATYTGAGYIANAKKFGAAAGDSIEVVNKAGNVTWQGIFSAVQDTGGTSGTIVLDTGAA